MSLHLPGTVGRREGDRAEGSRTLETTRELIQVKCLSGLTMRHRFLFKAGPGVGASSLGVWGGGLSASSASAAPHNSVYLLTHKGVAAWLCSFCWYFVEHLLHVCQTRPPWPSELRGFLFYEKSRRMGRYQGRRGPAPLSATSLVWAAPPLLCLQGLSTAHSLKPPVLCFLHVAGWTPLLGCHLSPSLYPWL